MKQGQISRIKNGKWLIRVQRKKDGERKSISQTVYGTRDSAVEALKTLLADIKKTESEPSRPYKNFNDLFDAYLEVTRPSLREQTYYLYQNIIRRYLRIPFGEMPIVDLASIDIEKFYAKLQERLSPETIYKAHVIFKTAYKKARQWEWVTKNPFEFVKPPKKIKKDKTVLTSDELNQFFSACKDLRTKTLWYFFGVTGARSQEVIAVRWGDIKDGQWHLSQVRIETPQVKKFDIPKTDKSKRIVPLADELLHLLKRLKVEQNIERLKAGSGWIDNDLVFATSFGNPLRLSNLGEKCSEIATLAGITKKIHPHLLRHSFISNAINSGANVKTVTEIVGHANSRVTLDIYTHTRMEDKEKVISNMSKNLKIV